MCTSWILLSFVGSFAQHLSPTIYCPQSKKRTSYLSTGKIEPWHFFRCNLLSVMTVNIFVLKKHWLVFELCIYFDFFFSFSGAVSIKTGRKRVFVGYDLMSVTVLCSVNSLFVLILRLFYFLRITAYFLSSDCFLVALWQNWQVQSKVYTLKMMPCPFWSWNLS